MCCLWDDIKDLRKAQGYLVTDIRMEVHRYNSIQSLYGGSCYLMHSCTSCIVALANYCSCLFWCWCKGDFWLWQLSGHMWSRSFLVFLWPTVSPLSLDMCSYVWNSLFGDHVCFWKWQFYNIVMRLPAWTVLLTLQRWMISMNSSGKNFSSVSWLMKLSWWSTIGSCMHGDNSSALRYTAPTKQHVAYIAILWHFGKQGWR